MQAWQNGFASPAFPVSMDRSRKAAGF